MISSQTFAVLLCLAKAERDRAEKLEQYNDLVKKFTGIMTENRKEFQEIDARISFLEEKVNLTDKLIRELHEIEKRRMGVK